MTSSLVQVWRATLSCLSRPADGDDVSPGEDWPIDWSMRLIPMNKVSTDLRNSTFMSRTHLFGGRSVREKCAQGGVSSVAEDWRAASPVSLVFSLS